MPNIISMSRIVLICAAVLLFIYGLPLVGLIVGTICGLSDYFDGWLARRSGTVTEIGAILDRLGDLVFEMVAMVFAVYSQLLPPLLFILYLLREVLVMSARQYVAEHRERGVVIATSFYGKLKTNFLGYSFFGIFLAAAGVLPAHLAEVLQLMAIITIAIGVVFSYISGYQYLAGFARAYDLGADGAATTAPRSSKLGE